MPGSSAPETLIVTHIRSNIHEMSEKKTEELLSKTVSGLSPDSDSRFVATAKKAGRAVVKSLLFMFILIAELVKLLPKIAAKVGHAVAQLVVDIKGTKEGLKGILKACVICISSVLAAVPVASYEFVNNLRLIAVALAKNPNPLNNIAIESVKCALINTIILALDELRKDWRETCKKTEITDNDMYSAEKHIEVPGLTTSVEKGFMEELKNAVVRTWTPTTYRSTIMRQHALYDLTRKRF
jgi:hypothetical protein